MPAEIGQLYGRAGAVELTKEFLSRPHRDGAARSRRQPVLVFTGPHGSGKTALLDKLAEWLQPVAPYARIDCAADDLSSSPRVLSALVFELNRTAGRYGGLAFPRFITGQLVLRQELVTDDRARACDQVRQALAEYRNIAALRDFLVEIGEDTWTVLHQGQAPPVSRTGVRYLAKLVLNGLIASRLGRLLLRRLAARRAGRADWATVHAWFRDDCTKENDEAGELYYALALGEVVPVARRLASHLPGGDAVSWLRRLHSVSAAPNKLSRRQSRGGLGQPGAAADRIRELTAGTDPRDVPLAPLARLVAALWIAADPLFASHQKELGDLYNEIQDDFDLIAPFSGNGLAVLRNEAARYRALGAGGGG